MAEQLVPRKPYLELRKLQIKENESEAVRKALFYHYHRADKIHEYFDPPRPYLNHFDCVLPEFNHSIERLSEKDEVLLNAIAPLDDLELESADSFNDYYQQFIGSKNKPDWDLVRVLVSDTLENYHARHNQYERLLSGGLNAWINRGDVVKLDEDEYQFKQENPIIDKVIRLEQIYFHARFYQSIGESLAAYDTRQYNPTRSEPETKKFAMQINTLIDKALHSGELPVYRRPANLRVEYAAYPVNQDDVIRWHDLKALLELKTRLGLPEYPVFMSWWPEIKSAMEAQIQSDEPETKTDTDTDNTDVYSQRLISFNQWLTDNEINPDDKQQVKQFLDNKSSVNEIFDVLKEARGEDKNKNKKGKGKDKLYGKTLEPFSVNFGGAIARKKSTRDRIIKDSRQCGQFLMLHYGIEKIPFFVFNKINARGLGDWIPLLWDW
ncbi:hypothetical protein [Methylocucumis oryzae]|uniref:hypothetical protein n=1 Tax=Methylocucumis oryzae TaxID=1632867 RepID=UPI00178CF515|nr:hypothetical protein [Methylocucumis oryzae]